MRCFASLHRLRAIALVAPLVILGSATFAFAQVKPKPPAKPAPKAAPKVAPKTVVPAPAPAPVVAAPSDLRFKTRYTTGDEVTTSVTYLKGVRERFELADMILLRQPDEKRTAQISRSANTYLVAPDGVPATAPGADSAAPRPPGVVRLYTTIVDTGERKPLFGREARHVKTITDKLPEPGACDRSKLRIETDGWYIDAPTPVAAEHKNDVSAAANACKDEVAPTQNGDPKALGFPVAYTTTFTADDGKPSVVTMEVTELEVTTLDSALFEIPAGMSAALNVHELSKAVSDANEVMLARGTRPSGDVPEKKPGVIRVGVPDVTNKGTEKVDTRALRTRLIAELAELKIDAYPLAAAPQAELELRAKEIGCDYLLMADIVELKASKPGGLNKMLKTTAREKTAGQDITEAKMSIELVPLGGKARLSTTTSGKDGGVGLKTGLGVARFAGSMYLKMYLGGLSGSPLGALNAMQMMNVGGVGMLGNPAMMGLQTGNGGTRTGVSLDRTAGAASFLMQQAMLGTTSTAQEGPSFDASLASALEDAAKKVADNLTSKKTPK